MNKTDKIFEFLCDNIHTVIMATTDENGKPVTCAIDIMDYDENALYFLTAKGKNFYARLKNRPNIALTGLQGESTMKRIAVSVSGKVRECDKQRLLRLLEKNPYMYEIYPTEASRESLVAFVIFRGSGEWFDLSQKPVERISFTFGEIQEKPSGYYISDLCIGFCKCVSVCPHSCIDVTKQPARILQEHCLHCGNCYGVCPVKAVERR